MRCAVGVFAGAAGVGGFGFGAIFGALAGAAVGGGLGLALAGFGGGFCFAFGLALAFSRRRVVTGHWRFLALSCALFTGLLAFAVFVGVFGGFVGRVGLV